MRTIIAGSRTCSDIRELDRALGHCGWRPIVVLDGEARGADALGEAWATLSNVAVEPFPADWKRYGKSAGYRRNEEMAGRAEALVALWDGKSPGTKNMIDIAQRKGLRVFIHSTAEAGLHQSEKGESKMALSIEVRGQKLTQQQLDAIVPVVNDRMKKRVSAKDFESACLKAMEEAGVPLALADSLPVAPQQLPEFCFVFIEEGGPGNYIRAVRRGEMGNSATTYDVDDPIKAQELVAHVNRRLGVTELQAECMLAGSMFGWDVPGADPTYVAAHALPGSQAVVPEEKTPEIATPMSAQEAYVKYHSPEERAIRMAAARHDNDVAVTEALELFNAGDTQGARDRLFSVGIAEEGISYYLNAWQDPPAFLEQSWKFGSFEQAEGRAKRPKKSALEALSEEQRAALTAFREEHGRTWKSTLHAGWLRAAYPGPLQQIRNEFGPSWLNKLTPADFDLAQGARQYYGLLKDCTPESLSFLGSIDGVVIGNPDTEHPKRFRHVKLTAEALERIREFPADFVFETIAEDGARELGTGPADMSNNGLVAELGFLNWMKHSPDSAAALPAATDALKSYAAEVNDESNRRIIAAQTYSPQRPSPEPNTPSLCG